MHRLLPLAPQALVQVTDWGRWVGGREELSFLLLSAMIAAQAAARLLCVPPMHSWRVKINVSVSLSDPTFSSPLDRVLAGLELKSSFPLHFEYWD